MPKFHPNLHSNLRTKKTDGHTLRTVRFWMQSAWIQKIHKDWSKGDITGHVMKNRELTKGAGQFLGTWARRPLRRQNKQPGDYRHCWRHDNGKGNRSRSHHDTSTCCAICTQLFVLLFSLHYWRQEFVLHEGHLKRKYRGIDYIWRKRFIKPSWCVNITDICTCICQLARRPDGRCGLASLLLSFLHTWRNVPGSAHKARRSYTNFCDI
jgi:hypothetical protein